MSYTTRRHWIIFSVTALVAILAPLWTGSAFGTITLSQDFDTGSLNTDLSDISGVSGNTVTLVPRRNGIGAYGADWLWEMYFRADGVQGLTPRFQIPPPLANVSSASRFVHSYDQVNWQYFSNGSVDGAGYYQFSPSAPFTQNQVYVSIALPYPTSWTDSFVASIKGNPYVMPTASSDLNLIIGHTPAQRAGTTTASCIMMTWAAAFPRCPCMASI